MNSFVIKRTLIILIYLGTTIMCLGQMSVYMEDYDWSTPDPSLNNLDIYIKKKSRRDKNTNNDMYEYRLQQQREAERRRDEEERQKALEAERQRQRIAEKKKRDAEFHESHKKLQSSLHSLPDYPNGLRGQNTTRFGLRGLNDHTTKNEKKQIEKEEPQHYTYPQSKIEVTTPQRVNSAPQKPYYKDEITYLQVIVSTEPEPQYYQGNRFFSIGGGWDFTDLPEIWQEEGEKNLKGFLNGRYMKWTKQQISSSSALGAELMQLYESLSNAISIRDTEKSIITRTLDTVKKAALTGDRKYVEEINSANLKDAYKLTSKAGIYQVPLNKKEAVGWVQKLLLKKSFPEVKNHEK